jgi:hypothetical protein
MMDRHVSLSVLLLALPSYAAFLVLSATGSEFSLKEFTEQHCVMCHDSVSKEGGLDLSSLDDNLSNEKTFQAWVKVHDRVREGDMPPKSEVRPTQTSIDSFLVTLRSSLHSADTRRQSIEGRALARRLNRDEYQNTLRDLLGVQKDYRPSLPEDGRAMGFDKVGSALSVSAEHLQAYMTTAREALDEAIAIGPPPNSASVRYPQRWDVKHFGKDFFNRFKWTFGNQPDALVRFGDFVEKIVGYRGAPVAGNVSFSRQSESMGRRDGKSAYQGGRREELEYGLGRNLHGISSRRSDR